MLLSAVGPQYKTDSDYCNTLRMRRTTQVQATHTIQYEHDMHEYRLMISDCQVAVPFLIS
jgi:hypothetical protein